MIIDRSDRISEYFDRLPGLANAMACIAEHPQWEPAVYQFEGGYVMYQEGETRDVDTGTYEAHRKYIDVQILCRGAAWYSLWNRTENMTEAVAYDGLKDCARYTGSGAVMELRPGMFAVFYPSDAHKPDRFLPGQSSTPYRKYVIKLEVP